VFTGHGEICMTQHTMGPLFCAKFDPDRGRGIDTEAPNLNIW